MPRSRLALRADCARCFALCCVAPAFAASADFAIDKPDATPCPNLEGTSFRCAIHDALRARGFPGCVAYDCFGAGQHVAQTTFGGRDWRPRSRSAHAMFRSFQVVRALHELRWYLTDARSRRAARPLHRDLDTALEEAEHLGAGSARALATLDVDAFRDKHRSLLLQASALVRGQATARRRGADLAGADLHAADLRAVDLRGACLIGADLRNADLRLADLLGADLRAADLRGADLSTTLFLAPTQVHAARGDDATKLPPWIDLPPHWTAAPRRRLSLAPA